MNYAPHYKALDDFFEKIKAQNRVTNAMVEELKKLIPTHCFTNLFIHGYFSHCHPRSETQLSSTTDVVNEASPFRVADVQGEFQKVTSKRDVTDHVVFSAILKLVFGAPRYDKSVTLDNVLFAVFAFNSSENLQRLTREQNRDKAVLESKFLRVWTKCFDDWCTARDAARRTGKEQPTLKDALQEAFAAEAELTCFLSQLEHACARLRSLCLTSSYLYGMLGCVLLNLPEDEREKAWISLATSLREYPTDLRVSNYLRGKWRKGNRKGEPRYPGSPVCYAKPFQKPFCLAADLHRFPLDSLHLKLFIVLVRLKRRSEAPLDAMFEDVEP